jgi:hypothetical protein
MTTISFGQPNRWDVLEESYVYHRMSQPSHYTSSQPRWQAVKTNSPLLPLLLKHVVEMLLSVLQTYVLLILMLSLLPKCCLSATLYKYTDNCYQLSRTKKLLLDNFYLTKITATSHTTSQRMFSTWVVWALAG